MALFSAFAVLLAFARYPHQASSTPTQPFRLKPRFELAAPLRTVPGVLVDAYASGYGAAQQLARSYNLQARILWIDGTANIDKYNTEAKIVELMRQIKEVGFNTVVFDAKPISGQVIYASAIAPRMTEWRGATLPPDLDPLAIMSREAKSQGLSLLVSMNAFSEGHKTFGVGPGYAKKEWQSVVYEPKYLVRLDGSDPFPMNYQANKTSSEAVTEFTNVADLPKTNPEGFAVLLGRDFHMQNKFDAQEIEIGLSPLPKGSILLYGTGDAADFLRRNYQLRGQVKFDSEAEFVPITDPRETQYPLMMNPNNPDVQKYELSLVQEVVRNYNIDGVIYDDRLRYEGINGDFSELTRQLFERHVGQKLNWPNDVFKFTLSRTLAKGLKPGPFYDAWIAWRAQVIHNYLAKVRQAIKEIKPNVQFGLYAGSWYGEYPALGNNYAAPQTVSGFWFATPGYRAAGNAPLLDFMISGCYYPTPTIYDAMCRGVSIGTTIEAAGTLTNRMVRDQCWTYAGIDPEDFKDDPAALYNALQAACASTQGVMLFDLSHGVDAIWPTLAKAFSQHKRPPHASTVALANVRRHRDMQDKNGVIDPPVIITAGSAGIGQ